MLWLILFAGVVWFLKEASGNRSRPQSNVKSILLEGYGGYRMIYGSRLAMWLDHPLAGVGIGQFGNNLDLYWKQRAL